MKPILLITFLLFSFSLAFTAHAQDDKSVTITASGSGTTADEAKQVALRSAIEQAFGTFISAKTEILNDQVVADEMASVTSGNIKSYEVLNQDQLPDGRWGVTLKAIVSVDKLTSFVQAKGISIEVKGGLFAMNIKQQLLNEEGEVKAVADMIGLLHEVMQTAFDYKIQSGEPQSIDAESKNWGIPLTVTAITNVNIVFCANYFFNTLQALSLSDSEVETYKSLNKEVFEISVHYKGKEDVIKLRKEKSIRIVRSLIFNWEFYTRLFEVYSGIDKTFGSGSGEIRYLSDHIRGIISFPRSGQPVGTFTWNDNRTLSQIEQMAGYSVKPRGVVSNFNHGGFVIYEEHGHGLVFAPYHIQDLYECGQHVDNPKIATENLVLQGYDDWYLPDNQELILIAQKVKRTGFGGFSDNYFWRREVGGDPCPFHNWNYFFVDYEKQANVILCPVRKF